MTTPATTDLALSPVQLLILADLQSHPEKAQAYNLADYVEFQTSIDVALLEIAISRVVARRVSFRLRLVARGHRVMQIVDLNVCPRVMQVDVSNAQDPHSKAMEWMEQQRQQCFDPLSTELYRFGLLRLGDQKLYWYCQFHHLIIDGVGLKLFKDLVADTYGRLQTDASHFPSDDQSQFEDYLRYHENYGSSEQQSLDREYWSNTCPVPTTLAARRIASMQNRPTLQSSLLRLDQTLSSSLSEIANSLQLRLPQLFIAAFCLYLHRATQFDYVTIELPTHGRVEPWMNMLIAACVNVLPVTIKMNPDLGLQESLQSINEQVRAALTHRRMKRADIRRFQRIKYGELKHCSVSINALPYSTNIRFGDVFGTPRLMSTLYVDDFSIFVFIGASGNQSIRLDACPINYREWELEAHLENFHRFLIALANGECGRLRELSFAEPKRVEPLDVRSQVQVVDSHSSGAIHEIFDAYADSNPKAIVVKDRERDISYAEYEQRANQVACALAMRGVGCGHRVGLFIDRSIDAGIAVLGILKAGAVCIPLEDIDSDDMKDGRLAAIRLTCVITDRLHRERASLFNCTALEIGVDELAMSTQRPESSPALSDPCYGYFRASEGHIQLVRHDVARDRSIAAIREFGLNSTDCIALYSSPTGFWLHDLFVTWLAGAKSMVVGPALSPEQKHNCLQENEVTVALLATAHWCSWLCFLEHSSQKLFSTLRTVVVGGQPIPKTALDIWVELVGEENILLFNCYGTARTGGVLTAKGIERSNSEDGMTVGRPLPDSHLLLLDSYGLPTPIGVVGEICAPNTDESIANESKLDVRPTTIRSGDRARFRFDGQIELFGPHVLRRTADGSLVDIHQVEDIFNQHPAVLHCAVVSHFLNLRSYLVCYFVLRTHSEISTEVVRAFLVERLPLYMVPTHLVPLAEIPLDANGAVDRGALALRRLPVSEVVEYVAPRTEIETTLVGIWTDVLQVERIGIYDNLFDLGVDSISATFALACIQEQFDIDLDMALLFETSTVAQLADRLNIQSNSNSATRTSLP